MNQIVAILFLSVNISFSQSGQGFLIDFLLGEELENENLLNQFNQFDFSEIWTKTENHLIFGIIGTDHQRIKIKLISVIKNPENANEYLVFGKSLVKGIICDFNGKITLTEIKKVKNLHFGVDDEFGDKRIKSQGILIADYCFKENESQNHSGIFNGKLYSKWYLDSNNHVRYDDIQSISDEYSNNAFIGTWKSHLTVKEKICNWADFRVPQANQDFDIGAGDFSPSKNYYDKGWENYQKAWLHGDKQAEKIELLEWWK